ncbi:conserved hypothetical protein [Gloeothece citriformis PCC 7424]|uniref:Uncharacterized protein n=1 Tax=Gloeothece citriformis (strain PCC 7424) TaxID=65393 RepID=B7KKQ6_GLOC7|nr:hypothetical protein [Gloeothece citriformis]ACK71025.1 conserved hypothetical protein [Gloeothece citriformis PCC 7424]
MLSSIHYLIRSRVDGQYLVARAKTSPQENEIQYLLVFKESFDALSYLNTHAPDLANQFSVESLPPTQLKGVLQRWGFVGIGVVNDPLEPRIQFVSV